MPKGVYKHNSVSEETKKKIREHSPRYWLGKKLSEETRKKLSESHKGKKHSEDHKRHQSEALKGREVSEETRKKIGISNSISLKGKKQTKEHMEKRVLKLTGKHYSKKKGGLTDLQKIEKVAGRKKPKFCELCGRTGRICFDHNHNTGQFRGWICLKCNSALGMVGDNQEILIKMIKYIKENL